ncbi:DUF4926 domain-containing protein [Trichormus azollae]
MRSQVCTIVELLADGSVFEVEFRDSNGQTYGSIYWLAFRANHGFTF